MDTKTYLKQIKFISTDHTYVRDITSDINKAVKKAGVKEGFVIINTKHTTLGIIINEVAEPNLLQDIIEHTLKTVAEDKRSTKVSSKYIHPTTDYKHRCQDNPYCNEIDEDYNAAAHIRALIFSHPNVVIPIANGLLELGKYQQVAVFEFDGRDGKGKNAVRQRIVQAWIHSSSKAIEI